MTEVTELLRSALSGGSALALPLALIGGVVSGINPCCLPLYPAAAATCCAARDDRLGRTMRNSLAFVGGMALTTSILGVVAALAGRTMTGIGGWLQYVIAIVPLAIGAHSFGWIRLPVPRPGRVGSRRGAWGAFLAGLLLSLILAPCGTPVLASVLSYAAFQGNVPYGGILLFVYGAGAGLPALLGGTAIARLAVRLDATGWRPWVDRVTGALAIGVGFYLIWTAGRA